MQEPLDLAFAALSDPTRRAILLRLASGEASVGEIAAGFPISQPAISRHLRLLEEAGLIEAGREGKARPRRLRPEGIEQAQRFLSEMASYWPDRFDRLDEFLQQTKDQS
ncbi:ArsR/SmtB family transcription factor [Tsuneonella sp. HG222]